MQKIYSFLIVMILSSVSFEAFAQGTKCATMNIL